MQQLSSNQLKLLYVKNNYLQTYFLSPIPIYNPNSTTKKPESLLKFLFNTDSIVLNKLKFKLKNMKIELESIGTIHTEFENIEGMPIQPTGAKGVKGKIVLDEKYAAGLKDLEDFSHIHLLYLLHKVEGYLLEVKPFMDNNTHGVFATRSPKRPNRIGSSVVKLDKIEGNTIYISNIDVLNGTPLLDIKPYVPQLYEDTIDDLKIGWFENNHKKAKSQKSDDRFK